MIAFSAAINNIVNIHTCRLPPGKRAALFLFFLFFFKMSFFKVNEYLEPHRLFSLDVFLFQCVGEMCLAVATQQRSCQTHTHKYTHFLSLTDTLIRRLSSIPPGKSGGTFSCGSVELC